MSDIDKAEELLHLFLGYSDPYRLRSPDELKALRKQVEEYFNKPVVIQDWNNDAVRIYVDSDKDVSFKWDDDNWTPDIIAFDPDELLRGLREIGVIQ